MKNKIKEMMTAFCLSLCTLLVISCNTKDKNQEKETHKLQTADSASTEAKKPGNTPHYDACVKKLPFSRLMSKANYFNYDVKFAKRNIILENYLTQAGLAEKLKGKLTKDSFNIKLGGLYKIEAITSSYFDCNQSNPSMRRHEIYYGIDGFYYLWYFAHTFNMVAYAEIKRDQLNELINYTSGAGGAPDQCGLHVYFGVDKNVITMSYSPSKNFDGRIPSAWFPKPNTPNTYTKAKCFTTATFLGSPDDLDRLLWSDIPLCDFTTPASTPPDDEINRQGNDFMNNVYFQYPMGFFHAQELRDLIMQNDTPQPGDPYGRCESIRIYLGYDPDPTVLFKVRLVAFAVDGTGKNIMTVTGGYDALMLDHSWPPQ